MATEVIYETDPTTSCRICLQLISGTHSKRIKLQCLARNMKGMSYQDVFWEFSGYLVQGTEPQQLCNDCAKELIRSYEFKIKCDEAQRILEGGIGFLKAEEEVAGSELSQVKVEIFDDLDYTKNDDEELVVSDNFVKNENRSNEAEEEEDYEGYEYAEEYSNDDTSEQQDNFYLSKQKKERYEQSESPDFSQFVCDYCNFTFKLRGSLRKHYERDHRDMRIHECLHCQKLHYTPSQLEYHIKRCKRRPKTAEEKAEASKKYQYICPTCGKLASSSHIKAHLKSHTIRNVNGEEIKETYICDICGARVSSRGTLIAHMKFQHLDHKLKCKYCEQQFRTPSVLSSHVRKVHMNHSQLLQCKKCDYVATTDTNLRRHRMSHSGKKMHKCHICNHEFLKRCRLMIHMASHSDARPFACDICGAAFKTTKAVQVHKKTHSEHDYECPVCQKTYLTNQLMRIHVQKNHPEYELPPPGTVFSKSARKRLAESMMRDMAMRSGIQKGLDEIVLTEAPPIEEALFFQPH